MTTQTYAQRTDPTPCLSPMDARKSDMAGYIRRKYNVPDCRDIVIKQGYITKDILPSPAMPWSDPYDDQFIIKRKLSDTAASAVGKMNELIDRTNEDISALLERWDADETLQAQGTDWLHEQIIQKIDSMFVKLSDSIKALAKEAYEKTYARSNNALGGRTESEPFSSAIFEKERFRLIFAALEKAKTKMTDRIEEAFNAPEEPEEIQKIGPGTIILIGLGALLLAALLTGCEDTKKKAEQLSGDAEHLAKIEAEIAAFLANGVEKYEIITEPGCCDVCADMTDQFFDVADYSPGVNAPPFHPNCRCGVRIYAAEEVGEENPQLSDGSVFGLACTTYGSHAGALTREQREANARYIYDYLTAQGWTTEAIAGLLGNISEESNMNPGAWESYNNMNRGYGLVQWTKYKDDYKFFAWSGLDAEAANEMATNDPKRLMDLQLEFLLYSMTQPGGAEHAAWYPSSASHYYPVPFVDDTPKKPTYEEFITSTNDPGDLAQVFHAAYEKSGDDADMIGERVDAAHVWYDYLMSLLN